MDSTIKIPELPELSFDEKSHIYRLDGVEIPSVSKVMEPLKASGYAGISERTLERAADKGSSVHNAIEMWLRFGVIDIPEEHRGYFNGFLEWWNQYKPELVASEVKVYHKLMRYAGTTDLLAYIDGKLTLVDYKTTYMEAIKTNINGSDNVITLAVHKRVKKIVCLSTDKAVYPTSAMGMTKAYMEKIAMQKAAEQDRTDICVTRFGNLVASRGSAVPLFIEQVQNGMPITDEDIEREGLEIGCAYDEIWNKKMRKNRSTLGWEANPWVFEYTFEVISKEVAEND